MEEEYIAGVDIGGTWIRVALCTKDLREDNIKKKTSKTLKETNLSISNLVCEILSEILTENQIKKEQLIGIGVASAGPLNIHSGVVFNNANLGFRVIPLKEPIEQNLKDALARKDSSGKLWEYLWMFRPPLIELNDYTDDIDSPEAYEQFYSDLLDAVNQDN